MAINQPLIKMISLRPLYRL